LLKTLALLGIVASTGLASTITYTLDATASGSLDGVSFTNSLFTITALASSSTPGTLFSSTVQVGGNSDTLNKDSSIVFVNQGACAASSEFPTVSSCVGFETLPNGDILDIGNNVFATYVLGTAIGPVTDPTPAIVVGLAFPSDSGGSLVLDAAMNGSFQATVNSSIPEPTTIILLLPTLVGAILLNRRHGFKF
jgi:hypothetical protein